MIECVTVGDMIPTHSYFYIDDASKHGFLIDAGAEGGRLAAHAAERGWTIERLLLTHCHFDHIGGVDDFRARIPCPVGAAAESPRYCSDPNWNLSTWGGAPMTLADVETFADGAHTSHSQQILRCHSMCAIRRGIRRTPASFTAHTTASRSSATRSFSRASGARTSRVETRRHSGRAFGRRSLPCRPIPCSTRGTRSRRRSAMSWHAIADERS